MKKIAVIVGLIIIAFSLTTIWNCVYGVVMRIKYPYVAGKTGKKCYESTKHNNNIKYHVYFKSMAECQVYVKQNQ